MKGVELFVIVLVIATAFGAVGYMISPGFTGLQTFNSPPSQVFSSATVNTLPYVLNLDEVFFDSEGDSLTYSVSDPAVIVDGNTLTFTPPLGSLGEYFITVTVSDGENTVAKPFTFVSTTSSPANEAPFRGALENPTDNAPNPTNSPVEPTEFTPTASPPSPVPPPSSESPPLTQSSDHGTSDSGKSISSACVSCANCTACLATENATCTLSGAIASAGSCITSMVTGTELDCAGFEIQYNTGGTAGSTGIIIGAVNRVQVHDCVVTDTTVAGAQSTALSMSLTDNALIQNNRFSANGTNSNQAGRFSGVNNSRILDNYFYAEGSAGSNAAMNFSGSSLQGMNVTGNVLYSEGTGSSFGLHLSGVAGPLFFSNNTIEMGGVKSSASLINSTIADNSINGSVNINGILGSIVTRNLIENNTILGVVVLEALGTVPSNFSDNKVYQNSITGTSAQTGIHVGRTNYTSLIDNDIVAGTGISLDELSLVTTLDGNDIVATSGEGLDMRRGSLNFPFSYNSAFGNNVSLTNLVSGIPIFYLGGTGISPACPDGTTMTTPASNHIHFIGCSNIILEDWTPFDAITIINGNNITIRNVNMRSGLDINGTNIVVHNSSITSNKTVSNDGSLTDGSGIYIENNTFNYTSTSGVIGVSGFGVDYSIRNNTFVIRGGSQPTGILADATASTGNRWTVVNNSINVFATTDGSAFALDWDASNSTIENNTLLANGSNGCCNEGMDATSSNTNVTVRNNRFISDDDGTGSTCCNYAITGAGTSWNIDRNNVTVNGSGCCNEAFIISGSNTLVNNNSIAVQGADCCHYALDYSFGTKNNQSITNNILTVLGVGADSDNFGIYFGSVTTANITNNTIVVQGSGDSHGGINLDPGTRITAQNNTILVNGTSSRGIWLTSTSNHNLFIGNNVSTDDGATYALSVEAAQTNNSFVNNTLNNTQYWINTVASSTTQFNNTRFLGPNSSVNITSFTLSGAVTLGRNNINVLENKTFVNTTNVSALNSSGIITLLNVPFNQPRARIDSNDDGIFTVCLSPECNRVTETNSTFIYTTTHFTSHAAAERISSDDCPFLINGTYTLTQNITCGGTAVSIEASNLVLDCAGFTVTYDTDGTSTLVSPNSGILTDRKTNVTLRNCIVNDGAAAGDHGYGIYFVSTNLSSVINNTVTALGTSNNYAVSLTGFSLTGSENNLIENNTLASNGSTTADIGIVIEQSSDNNIVRLNNITTNGGSNNYGILVAVSGNSTVANNSIRTNGTSGNFGITLQSVSDNNTVENNTVVTTGSSSANNGIEASGSNNIVRFNRVFTNGTSDNDGIRMVTNANNNVVANNTVYADGSSSDSDAFGIYVDSTNNIFANNTGYSNGTGNDQGFVVFSSSNNTITANTLRTGGGAGAVGITLLFGSNNTVADNFITTNGTAGGNYGIHLNQQNLTTLRNNSISTNGGSSVNRGIYVFGANSSIVTRNHIQTNGTLGQHHGIRIEGSRFVSITYNTVSTDGVDFDNQGIEDNNGVSVDINYNVIRTYGASDFNYGAALYGSTTSNMSFNNITTNGLGGFQQGMKIEFGSQNNNINNNQVSTNGAGNNSAGLVISQSANNNTFRNNVVSTNGNTSEGIRIRSFANNSYFINTTISTNGTNSYGVQMGAGSGGGGGGQGADRTFLNDTRLVNVSEWIQTATNSNATRFVNITFENTNGSTQLDNFTLTGNLNVTKARMDVYANRSFLNTTILPRLNSSGTVRLNSLAFTTPRAVVDFEDDGTFANCNSPVCENSSYSAGTFTFDVSHFTSYAASETTISSCACPGLITVNTTLDCNPTSNVSCIELGSNNLYLDCNGYNISYGSSGVSGYEGVSANNKNNVTVRNCNIFKGSTLGDNTVGVRYTFVQNSKVVNSNITNYGENNADAIRLQNGTNTTLLENNTIFLNATAAFGFGVFINQQSSRNILNNNSISTTGGFRNVPIECGRFSENNTVENNTVYSSTGSPAGIDAGLQCNGTVIRYNTVTVEGISATGIGLDEGNASVISFNNITSGPSSDSGIAVSTSTGVVIENNRVTSVNNGMYIDSMESATVQNNQFTADGTGFDAYTSVDTLVRNNTLTVSNGTSMSLYDSIETTIENQTIPRSLTASLLIGESDTYVEFLQNISVTPTTLVSDVIAISTNYTLVNTSNPLGAPFNKSANITLGSLNFTDPRPLVDYNDDGIYAICTAPDCFEHSYDGQNFTFNVSHFTSYAASETCPYIIGTSTTLTENVTCPTTAVIINANNVALDCAGYNVTFDTAGGGIDHGINVTGVDNISISNCIIIDGSAGGLNSAGINITDANVSIRIQNNSIQANGTGNTAAIAGSASENITIINNTLQTSGSSNKTFGITFIDNVHRVLIANNSIQTRGTSQNMGIKLEVYTPGNNIDHMLIQNNTIVSNGTGSKNFGVSIIGFAGTGNLQGLIEANNITVRNNSILTDGVSENHGLRLAGSNLDFLDRNYVRTYGASTYAAQMETNTTNHTFTNNIFNTSTGWIRTQAESNPAYFNSNSTFTNTTFASPNGSIRIIANFTMPDRTAITQDRLNITSNNTYFNATNLSFTNQSAEITLAGLTFADPQVLVDYEDDGTFAVCSSPDCNETSYAGGVFVFNVSHFTSYAASETVNASTCPLYVNTNTTLGVNITCPATAVIVNASNVELDCAGYLIQYASTADGNGINATGRTNVTIRNCIVTTNSTGVAGYGVYFTGTNQSTITNTSFDVNLTAIRFESDTANNTLNSSRINNAESYGAIMYGDNHTVTENIFFSSNYTTLFISGAGNTIVNNTFSTNRTLSTGTIYGSEISGSNSTIINNTFINLHEYTVSLPGLSDSLFFNNTVVSYAFGGLVYIGSNTTFANSSIVGMGAQPIFFTGSNSLVENVTFVGNASITLDVTGGDNNQFRNVSVSAANTLGLRIQSNANNNSFDGFKLYAFTGSTIDNSYNNTIANSSFIAQGGDAVQIFGASRNNTFDNTSLYSATSFTVRMLGQSQYNSFINSSLTGPGNIIDFTNAGNNTINNTILHTNTSWITSSTSASNNFTNITFFTLNGTIRFPNNFTPGADDSIPLAKVYVRQNKSFVNSTNLSYLNQTAQITLRNLSFTDPRVVVDYEDDGTFANCDSPQCDEESYTGGVFVFNVSSFTSYAASEFVNASACPLYVNTNTTLGVNITCPATAVIVNVSNVEFDCAGYSVNYSNTAVGTGIEVNSLNNVTVKNCYAFQGNETIAGSFGIAFTAATNSTLINSTGNSSGSGNDGIRFVSGSRNTITNNTGVTNNDIGIFVSGETDTVVTNNLGFGQFVSADGLALGGTRINATNNTGRGSTGIEFFSSSNSNYVNNTGIGTSSGLRVRGSSNNNRFTNNTGITNSGSALDFALGSTNNNLTGTLLQTNSTWISTEAASSGNNISNTTFSSIQGSILSINTSTVPISISVTTQKLNTSLNRSFLNSTNVSFLNVSSQITLNNIAFANPDPVVDFEDDGTFATCSSPQCDEVSYAGGVFVFNVSSFTSYAASDAPECPLNINTSTTLNASISCPATAINVVADNVALDCAGYTVNYSETDVGVGINVTDRNNITIRNCLVGQINASTIAMPAAILFLNTTNSTIRNTTAHATTVGGPAGLLISGGSSNQIANSTGIGFRGIYLTNNAHNNSIYHSQGLAHLAGGLAFAVEIDTSHAYLFNVTADVLALANGDGMLLSGQNITVLNSTAIGSFPIGLVANIENSTIANNTAIGTFGMLLRGRNLTVENNIARGFTTFTPGAGLYLDSSINETTFRNNTFSGTTTSNAIRIDAGNVTFINTTAISTGVSALSISRTNVTFINTTLRTTSHWLNTTTGGAVITNTLFENLTSGSIRLIPSIILPAISVDARQLYTAPNRSYVNSTNLSTLNTSAQISLFGITFGDPRPVVDYFDSGTFVNCNPPDCTEISFAGGVYVFNVSHFTSFAAQENSTFVINLSADKFDSPDPVARGSQLSYQIVLNNTGNATAINVTVNESYPSGVVFVSAQPTPIGNSTFSVGNIVNGTSFVINITVNVSSALANGSVLNNTINVSFANSSGEVSQFSDSELTTVLGAPVLVSIKSDTPDPVVKGQQLNYTILLNNTGDDTAFNVSLTETYPVGVTLVTTQPAPSSGNNTFTIGTLAPNQSFLVNITVTVGSNVANGTILTNNVNASFRNSSGSQAVSNDSETTTVIGFPRVFTNKTDTPDPVAKGTALSYTITIANTGDEIAYNNTVVEGYPSGTLFVSSTPAPTSGNDTFVIATLAAGASTTINITLTVSPSVANGTVLNNSYNLTFANVSGVNTTLTNSTTTTVLGAPIILAIKSDTPDPVIRGQQLNYSILINNTGDNTAFNVTLSETYPAGVSFVTAQPTPTGNNTFAIGTLLPNQSFLVNITVTVGSNVANGTILTNNVNASFRNSSGQQGTANDSETTTVLGIATVTVVKNDTPDPVNNGSVLSYTITITNTGDEIAYNVTAVEGYPVNVSLTTTVPAPTSGNDTFTLGDLLPGASTTINITVTVDPNMTSGVLNNGVNVTFTNVSGVNVTTNAFQATTVTTPGVPATPSAGGGGGGGTVHFNTANITREIRTPIPISFPTAAPSNTPAPRETPQTIPAIEQSSAQELNYVEPEQTQGSLAGQAGASGTTELTASTTAIAAIVLAVAIALLLGAFTLLKTSHPAHTKSAMHQKQTLFAKPTAKPAAKPTKPAKITKPAPKPALAVKSKPQLTHDLKKLNSDVAAINKMLRDFDKKLKK